jgi:predicted DNA-binding transcriptional regulator AlpA
LSDEILTMSEAAAILKMTEKQVYELIRRRSLERMEHPFPAFNINAKAKRVRRSDLMAWIDAVAKQKQS